MASKDELFGVNVQPRKSVSGPPITTWSGNRIFNTSRLERPVYQEQESFRANPNPAKANEHYCNYVTWNARQD